MRICLIFMLFVSFSPLASDFNVVEIDGYKIEYELAGKGDKVILLEAGGGASLRDWDPVFQAISEKYKTIRYSRVGNGNSQKSDRHFTSILYAEHVSSLLLALDIKQPITFVAHSYGGSIARDFAAKYPSKLDSMLLVDPSSEHDVDIMRQLDLNKANLEIEQIKLDDMKNGMSNVYLDFWSKRPLPDYPEIPDIPVTVITSVRTMTNPPNLFFSDNGRKMWGELWQDWVSEFPQGRSVLTKNSGHHIQFDEPELVIKELFLLMNNVTEN
ncbi:alpha/beta fold hydrolase [Pseudoalteromonas sp. H105]|uniref:alpha/beta fold hydrolase n=1 Tax=Pseudoalteromonas sp. H105 TaxID=1348393 RepID=UPI0007321D1F|nr:alpha/beta hydrolase [Pseudoalteromonas sp. H105]KTF13038.1 alpha/beta hydrolase [Pseudoalteromonas sp. H105]